MPFTPVIGVLGYVLHPTDDTVLMVQRSRDGDLQRGKFNGLGGKLEPGEDVVGCLRRELHEEAGITVTAHRLRGTIAWPGFGVGGEDWFGFVFVVDGYTGTPPDRNDDGRLHWIARDRLLGAGPPLPMWPGDAHFLPLVFDDDHAVFHGVMPYADGRPTGWHYSR